MTDYEKTLHLRLMLVVAKTALAKIAFSGPAAHADRNQHKAMDAHETLIEMQKVLDGP